MQAAIVGAGLVGRLLGWRLLERGAQVTIIDAKDRNYFGTGRVAAAMIAPGTEAVTAEPLVEQIGHRSLMLWPQWLKQLGAATGQTIAYDQSGTLVVAHAQDRSDWQHFMQRAEQRLVQSQCHKIGHNKLQDLEPDLALNFDQAGFFPEEAVLDNHQLYTSLAQYLDQNHAQWYEDMPLDKLPDDGQLKGFKQGFDWIFDCRGTGARQQNKALRAVRGEVIRVYAPEVDIKHAVRLMHPRFPLYIAPKGEHHYVLGATQIESNHSTPVTVRSALELLSALYSLHQGFAEAQILSLDVGCRSAYADNLPRVERTDKRISINGLYRHGYLLAPALVDDVIASLDDNPLHFPQVMH